MTDSVTATTELARHEFGSEPGRNEFHTEQPDKDGRQARHTCCVKMVAFEAAQYDERHDYLSLAPSSNPANTDAKIEENFARNAGFKALDAAALGDTYREIYHNTYELLRAKRLANGGTLDTDPEAADRLVGCGAT